MTEIDPTYKEVQGKPKVGENESASLGVNGASLCS